MDLKGEFQVWRAGNIFHKQTMEFPNLSNEQAGQMNDYMDACKADLVKVARKPVDGSFTIKLLASVDSVGASDAVAEGLTYKDVVQFQRKMHNHQDKLIKFAEDAAESRPPTGPK